MFLSLHWTILTVHKRAFYPLLAACSTNCLCILSPNVSHCRLSLHCRCNSLLVSFLSLTRSKFIWFIWLHTICAFRELPERIRWKVEFSTQKAIYRILDLNEPCELFGFGNVCIYLRAQTIQFRTIFVSLVAFCKTWTDRCTQRHRMNIAAVSTDE